MNTPQRIILPVFTPANGFPETDWPTLLASSLTSAAMQDLIRRLVAVENYRSERFTYPLK